MIVTSLLFVYSMFVLQTPRCSLIAVLLMSCVCMCLCM